MLERLEKLLAEATGSTIKLSEEMDLVKDVGLNSMDMIQMIVGIEEEFGIEISDRALRDIVTVGDLIRMIEAQR